MGVYMQEVDCYNCGSEVHTYYASENGFNLVKCNQCGLLFVNPQPTEEDIEQAHKIGVHRGSKDLITTGDFIPQKIDNYLEILNEFFPNKLILTGKKWLDIGCGYGEFLEALIKFTKGDIKAKGIEPNIYKQRTAQKRKLNVRFFDLEKHTDKYDVISLLNVYSHLIDPPKSIQSWKRLLNPGGELFLETGDTADFDSKDHHRPFKLPDHLSFASEKIVTDILNDLGFEIIEVKKYPYNKLSLKLLSKELLKFFWPNKHSRFIYLMNPKSYINSDMYIRARLHTSTI